MCSYSKGSRNRAAAGSRRHYPMLARPPTIIALSKVMSVANISHPASVKRSRSAIMSTRLLCAALLPVVVCLFGVQLAHADIYTWVDASGKVNVSNMAPPESILATDVKHEIPPKVAMRPDTGIDAARLAEVHALSERVQQLEHEVEFVRRPAPSLMEYRPIAAPPAVQYPAIPAPLPVQYAGDPAPPASAGCDPAWMNCGLSFGPGIYPVTVIVVRPSNFRRPNPLHRGPRVAVQRPVRIAGGFHAH